MLKILYQIWWKGASVLGDLPLCDYLDCYNWLERRQVISTDKKILEKTVEY